MNDKFALVNQARYQPISLPLVVSIEIGEMITLRDLELLTSSITLLLTPFWSVEYGGYRKHGHNDLQKSFVICM